MRVIEHNHFSRQPPNNAPPTVHFPLCLRRNAGLRPGIFVRSVRSVHPVHSPLLKRRQKAAKGGERRHPPPQCSITPALHSANCQRSAPPPIYRKRSNRLASLPPRLPPTRHRITPGS